MLDVGCAGFFQHAGERGLLLAHLRGARPVLRADIVLRHLQAVLLGQVFNGLNEGHAAVLHQETDGIAVFAAVEAVIKLLGRADRKGRRLFTVERAQAHEVGAALFQLNITPDDVHHVGAGQEFLNECLGDGHGCEK